MKIADYQLTTFERWFREPPKQEDTICTIGCWRITRREAEAVFKQIGFYGYYGGIPAENSKTHVDGRDVRFHPKIDMVWIDSQYEWIKYSTLFWIGRILERHGLITKRTHRISLKERFYRNIVPILM